MARLWNYFPRRRRARDLRREKDIGIFADNFEATVATHGVVLVRIFPTH
jgi:hypothetical protein